MRLQRRTSPAYDCKSAEVSWSIAPKLLPWCSGLRVRSATAWINWPARVAALMAAELGVEAHPMQKVLETHVRAQLAELAEVRPEFR